MPKAKTVIQGWVPTDYAKAMLEKAAQAGVTQSTYLGWIVADHLGKPRPPAVGRGRPRTSP